MVLQGVGVITEIKKKSTIDAFKGAQVGDNISISVSVKAAGQNRGRTYATYLRVNNIRTGQISFLSFNQIGRVLENITLEQVR